MERRNGFVRRQKVAGLDLFAGDDVCRGPWGLPGGLLASGADHQKARRKNENVPKAWNHRAAGETERTTLSLLNHVVTV